MTVWKDAPAQKNMEQSEESGCLLEIITKSSHKSPDDMSINFYKVETKPEFPGGKGMVKKKCIT